MIRVSLQELRGWAGIGVAGNFAGHLEQAGEAADFVTVDAEAGAPKGIFPFYLPGHDSFLATFPLSDAEILAPDDAEQAAQMQLEPEVALACEVDYGESGVAALRPFGFGAFNDCSIRRPGAAKISEKKNWGACSKGVATEFVPVGPEGLEAAAAGHRLASHLRRDGELHAYGVDSPLSGYSYFGQRLLDWVVERLNDQAGGEGTPLEPVGDYLERCGRPDRALVAIGATRYTEFGESSYLRPGDEAIVTVYEESLGPERPASELRQRVALPAASA